MQQTEERSRALPEVPSNDPVGEVLRVFSDLQKKVSERFEGTSDEDDLLQPLPWYSGVRYVPQPPHFAVPWECKEDSNQ